MTALGAALIVIWIPILAYALARPAGVTIQPLVGTARSRGRVIAAAGVGIATGVFLLIAAR